MKFLLLKFFLGFIGITFLILFFFSFIYLINNLYFSEENLIDYLFIEKKDCDSNLEKRNSDICISIATFYWLFVVSFFSLIISFICLFPFFTMKKKVKII